MTPNDSTKSHRMCVEVVDAALEFAVPIFFREEPPIHPPSRHWANLYCRCQWTA